MTGADRPAAGAMTGAESPPTDRRRLTEAVEGRRHDRPQIRARRFSRRRPAQAAAAMAVGREAGRSRECRCRLPAPRPAAGAMTGANRPAQED